MRRSDITKKQIIKALSVGLSAAMIMQPMTAMADEIENQVLPVTEEPGVNAADEEVASENIADINTAITKTEDAIGAEAEAYGTAAEELINKRFLSLDDMAFNDSVAEIGLIEDNDINVLVGYKGFKPIIEDIDDSAKEFESDAADHIEDAKEILENAEKVLTGDEDSENEEEQTGILDEFEEEIEAVDEALSDATKAAGDASINKMKAEDALEGAMNATNSSAAGEFAEEVRVAAEDASGNNVDAQAAADEAYAEYKEALALYNDAVKVAEEANKAADAAVKSGLGDAERALYDAKLAEQKAENLKKNLERAKENADSIFAYDKRLLGEANDAIDKLDDILDELDDEKKEAKEAYDAAKEVQNNAQKALNQAAKAKQDAPSDWDIKGLEWQYGELAGALEIAKWNLHNAQENLNGATNQKELAQAAYDAADAAYKAIAEAYAKAQTDLEEAQATVTELTEKEADLKDNYGENIISELDSLRADEEGAAERVIALIGGVSNVGKFELEGFDNGIFQGETEDGTVKYFTYAIAENGTVSVINVTKRVVGTVTEKVDATVNDNLSEEEMNAIIASLEEGTFFTEMEKVAGEQTYTVKYTEVTTEKRGNKHQDKIGDFGTYAHDNGQGTKTYYVEFDYILNEHNRVIGQTWWFTDDYKIVNGHYVVDRNAEWDFLDKNTWHKIEVTTTKEQTVYGVNEAGLNQYKDKSGYSKTEEDPVMTTVYKVTSGVVSKEVTASELEKMEGVLKSDLVSEAVAGQEALYEVTVKGGELAGMSHNVMRWNAPEREGGEYKYNYSFTYGGIEYSTDKGNLKWSPNEYGGGKWVYKTYSWNWCPLDRTIFAYTKTDTIENVTESNIAQYRKNTDMYTVTKTRDAIEGKEAVYRVYYNDSMTTKEYGYSEGDNTNFEELTQALITANKAVEDANAIVTDGATKLNDFNSASDRLNAATEKFNKAQKDYDDLLAKKNAKENEKNNKLAELNQARAEKQAAEKAYNEALKTLNNARSYANKAKGELDKINGLIGQYTFAKNVAVADKNSIEKALKNAQNEVTNWTDKVGRATKLAEAATEAREQAEEARDAIKNIKASNLGAEALAKAEAELKDAEAAYKEAQGLADQALEDAEAAQEAYEKAVQRVNDLIAEENRRAEEERRRAEEDNEEPTPETVIPETLPAMAPVTGITLVAAAPVAVAEEVVEEVAEEVAPEVVIEEEETAKADAPEVEETEIADEETPLAPAEEAAKMSWWWILVVLVLGTTGAELYRRHMVKKNAEKVEK